MRTHPWLRTNRRPSLKGHFSRLEYQSQAYFGRPQSHTIPQLILHLPPGIHSTYYYDLVGNVSTSQDRKSTRLNSSHSGESRMPSSA